MPRRSFFFFCLVSVQDSQSLPDQQSSTAKQHDNILFGQYHCALRTYANNLGMMQDWELRCLFLGRSRAISQARHTGIWTTLPWLICKAKFHQCPRYFQRLFSTIPFFFVAIVSPAACIERVFALCVSRQSISPASGMVDWLHHITQVCVL